MTVTEAISSRRSIRQFRDLNIPREEIEKILEAAILAPSAKNKQPWRFIVLEGSAKDHLATLMREGAAWCKTQGIDIGSCEWSARCVAQAPVTVLILNNESTADMPMMPAAEHNMMDLISIGASIQNMLITAESLGLGTLWIGDIMYAYPLIRQWLGISTELVSAVSIGYAAETPGPRPRIQWQEITRWCNGAGDSCE